MLFDLHIAGATVGKGPGTVYPRQQFFANSGRRADGSLFAVCAVKEHFVVSQKDGGARKCSGLYRTTLLAASIGDSAQWPS